MRALPLFQPYAGLIRLGIKTIETRWWSTTYRGPVLICSTKGTAPENDELLANFAAAGYAVRHTDPAFLNGVTQCVVDVVDVRVGTPADDDAACCHLLDVNPKTGKLASKYAFVLQNTRPVVQKPVKCGRKWFNVPDNEIEFE